MLTQGDLIYIQKPTQGQQRVLIPLDIVALEQGQIIIETSQVFDWLPEDGQVLVYYDRRRDFLKQSAKYEVVIHEEDEDQVDGVMRLSIELLGEPVDAESRQTFRVSTVISGRTAHFAEEGEVSLVDVSASGYAVIASGKHNVGEIIKTTLNHDGRQFTGTACVQSVCELDTKRTRYGMFCVDKRQPGNNLNQGLLTISMAVQREQLRRLSRAS
ncbi:MAG TPA: hypothetical protein DCM28_20550 [Phycisphaerales bacterium]|nr:hypothetical protein [Phycisphaerales bacterium]|tara:strand:+ start:760 stop:1401 length:642 start_codon:yes stop_codon:yes gene_type:complete